VSQTPRKVYTPVDPGTFNVERRVDWFGTVRARAGILATDNWLLYATGGLAFGKITDTATVVQAIDTFGNALGFSFLCAANAPCYSGASSRTSAGWTAGAGTETMVTKNLSLKFEYLYVNLDRLESVGDL
jgi:outer membrane immunogenic protein